MMHENIVEAEYMWTYESEMFLFLGEVYYDGSSEIQLGRNPIEFE